MAITAKNIIVGIGTFKVDSVDVGATEGGISVEKAVDIFEKEIDQAIDAVGIVKVKESYVVRTQLAEATLANLKIVWDQSLALVEGGGTKTLSLGMNATVTEHALEFKGKSPDGYDRTYTVYKAVIFEVGAHALQKGDKTIFPVSFRILPDLTKGAGQEYGKIVDTVV